ncbi:anthranilate phosphoribosyltransferase [Janibacter sp. YIM B02568]|uniref:anthranilate phosphoribosyltransferase n=1 Tax=Janibacter endophyticus TaxID=2806261 RepID=UPI001950D5D7|nr:anthranilate phosphoribosyltransferase [Janibacter endophyticus]MBM6546198.1 anthranilate phosphoribosyltransferase [Janibacter endophyticus]
MSASATSPGVSSGGESWPEILTTLLDGDDLSPDRARWAMEQVMSGEADPVAVAGFLVALRAKGESVPEVEGLVDVMLGRAVRIDVPGETVDIVGTGGDRLNTVNISTMSAVALAATGLTVVKHGNRAASSMTGTADVLEHLGIPLTLAPEVVRQVALDAGITFCFANAFHPSMRHAAPARVGLRVPTVFNILGPMTNPAQPRYSAVGVANPRQAPLIAGVFAARGRDALVFRGDEGLDELSPAGPSRYWWVAGGEVREGTITPEDVGLERCTLDDIRGGEPAANAEVARAVFRGERVPARTAVLLNGAAAHALATAQGQMVEDPAAAIAASVEHIAAALDDGRAEQTLARWSEASHRLAG